MFANVGWGEMLVLVIAGLVILGPERLPGAIRWTSGALRQARDYISGATSQLRDDLGPEFEDLREPLSELQQAAWHDAAGGAHQASTRRRRFDLHRQVRRAGQATPRGRSTRLSPPRRQSRQPPRRSTPTRRSG